MPGFISKKPVQTLGFFGLLSATVYANPLADLQLYVTDDTPLYSKFNYSLGVSHNMESGYFDWSIANDLSGRSTPNILSELTYKDLKIQSWTLDATANYRLNGTLDLTGRFEGTIGSIGSGLVSDSDYSSDYKTNEWSRSNSNPAGSNLGNLKVSLGINALIKKININPVLGFSLQKQKFIKREGIQVVSSERTQPTGTELEGLNSSYLSEWSSIFTGMRFTRAIGHTQQQLGLNIEYHLADYEAEADWNLRQSFQHPKSFEHMASGSGAILQFNYGVPVFKKTLLNFKLTHEKWQTSDGIDRLFFSNNTIAETRLVETNWKRSSASIGIEYSGKL